MFDSAVLLERRWSSFRSHKKSRLEGRLLKLYQKHLLDFGFFEFHVLFCNRIIFTLDHFLGHGAAVFLCNVKEACVSCAFQLNFDCGGFCHD